MTPDGAAPDASPLHAATPGAGAGTACLDTVIALYDFPGTQPAHLPLQLGDTVHVLAKAASGWWDGVLPGAAGAAVRGWFPRNYVRSVNYVQPVLDRLQSKQEIDSLTAANTAANVLIPLFTSLLQKNWGPLARDLAPATRKNSVVSFALSDASGEPRAEPPLPPPRLGSPLRANQASFASTLSYSGGSVAPSLGLGSYGALPAAGARVLLTPVLAAEDMVARWKDAEGKNVIWTLRLADNGSLVYYCEELGIHCAALPLARMSPAADSAGVCVDLPSREATGDVSLALKHFPSDFGAALASMDLALSSRSSLAGKSFDDSAARGSTSSTMSQTSASSYHNFSRPFFITPGLFYSDFSDISRWTDLRDHHNYLLDLTWRALETSNKQLFAMHLSELTKTVSIMMNAARLTQPDFVDTRLERSIRHRVRRVSEAFAQMYINSLLHLSVMHYSDGLVGEEYLTLGIHNLNKSTSGAPHERPSASSRGSGDTTIQQFPASSKNSASLSCVASGDDSFVSYLLQIEGNIAMVRSKMNSLIDIFVNLSKDKQVHARDYDSSDISEDEGEDRFNVLPQVYPRFISNEFNGGNWCNPFFTGSHRFLNLSGDHLKNKFHLKTIIDNTAYDRAKSYTDEVKRFTDETLGYLDASKQHMYYNEALLNSRNEDIIRVMYKYLHHASHLVDLLESFDFTLFSLVKKASSDESAPEDVLARINTLDTTVAFEHPVVLEFFQNKQDLHDSLAKIIINIQALTLEDPDAFASMKDEDFSYSRDAMKEPLEKSAMLLSQILSNQQKNKHDERITFDQDYALYEMLENGASICDNILSIIKVLIEERETVLNYATRVMHDNFNVELLIIERNNTSGGLKPEDTGGQYFGDNKKKDDTPWFLEGDDEYDLLVDMNGSIKGGTRKALVAHLTHHSTLDNAFNTIFLISFATIMSISELLDLLIQRFQIEAPEGLSYEEYLQWTQMKQDRIRLKVLNMMKLILENHWSESFNIVSVLQKWLKFLNRPEVQTFPITKRLVQDIERVQNGETVSTGPQPLKATEKAPAPLIKGFSLRKTRLLDIEYVELARQLTLREFKLYCNISKLSCIHKVWGKRSGVNESISSIQNFIRSSNQLTNFVAYLILRKDDTRKRVKVIRYFVQVAEWCRQYNNFSSMTAIISALYSSPIHRLKRTWAFVTKDITNRLQNMNKLMNSSRNFNEYRDMLKFIGSELCVPFFGVYLSDLTFVYHGNPDHLLNRTRMVNFAKRAKTVEIVTGIDRFKHVHYNFHLVPDIQTFIDLWFDKCPTIDEQYQLSLNIEPREEKPRHGSASNAVKHSSGR
ncbi:cell division control protein 25 [Metschnikowia bicuspidata var. bicuspidata NRRL YB-4993]|uniref:Cell division control protein 25 n=1 Tax=Metschnikowia bicuspidata var. bicuspidata NRRL YB-4993 TaxID=869754 RepID=A0A1A0HJV2_9ASCO|nr:cell division control protein 25 [Metschnikowia bicuspidata var. bicuspidata NRRL YB-4993]OBA24093.1 cell division control protein 25 [Metschnikowia bicuspidata var. bicuspidata NRRL YB-4993]